MIFQKYFYINIISLMFIFILAINLKSCFDGGPLTRNQYQSTKNPRIWPLMKSDQKWKKSLSPEQYHILREKGTEPAFSGEYNKIYKDGVYICAACNQKLFESGTKFDSGTGWPSFYQPIKEQSIAEIKDTAFGMERIELVCSNCGGHLGHVFNDGPQPTGLRYCINSLSLKFNEKK